MKGSELLCPKLKSQLFQWLDAPRSAHSLRVAQTCSRYARESEVLEPERAYAMGLCHDMAKQRTPEELAALIAPDVMSQIQDIPALWHGWAAAEILRREHSWAAEEADLLEGISLHSSGSKNPSLALKVLFCADFLDPERPFLTEKDVQSYEVLTLEERYETLLRDRAQYLLSQEKKLDPFMSGAYRALSGEVN